MMAFGNGQEDDLKEGLLDNEVEHGDSPSARTIHSEDDYDVLSDRETLVFEERQHQKRYGRSSFCQTHILSKLQPGSVKGSMFTMTVAIVGAGVLALPYAVAQTGLILGILLIIKCAAATNFTLRNLLVCANISDGKSYMDLAYRTGGKYLALFTQSIICLNLFGTCVGYLVGGAELIQLAMQKFLGTASRSLMVDRQALILILCFALILPLSLFRTLEPLRFTSLFSIACIVFMTLVVVIKYFVFVHEGFAPSFIDQLHHITLFTFDIVPLLRCIPLVIFAYTCHPNVLPIYQVLKRPSNRRMFKVMDRSLALGAAVYSLVGFFVVLTFGRATDPNFLKNDYKGDGAVILGCLGFSVALVLTGPLFVHTLRDNLLEATIGSGRLALPIHLFLSTVLVLAVLIVALTAGNIASVLGFLGATTNPLICFVLPAAFVWKLTPERLAQKYIALALAVMAIQVSVGSLLQKAGFIG